MTELWERYYSIRDRHLDKFRSDSIAMAYIDGYRLMSDLCRELLEKLEQGESNGDHKTDRRS